MDLKIDMSDNRSNQTIPLIDAHCHLQDPRIFSNINEIVSSAKSSGVSRMICCATNESDWDAVSSISKQFDSVVPSFGLHPWFVGSQSALWKKQLGEMLEKHPGSGVGEIGLDFSRTEADKNIQRKFFIEQLSIATQLGRFVSVHCCRAWGMLTDILTKLGPIKNGGLIHSYNGPAELVSTFEKLNWYISFSGRTIGPKTPRSEHSLRAVASNRLLIETDAPDGGFDGIQTLNEPANLPRVLETVAQIRGEEPSLLALQIFQNSQEFLGKGLKLKDKS